MKMQKSTERLAVLSLNIFLRPLGIHSGKWYESTGDYKDLRASLLLRKIKDYDIVLLQEMFEVGTRQRRFLKEAADLGFKYYSGSVWPRLWDRYLIDGGLLILSRYPIIKESQYRFTQGVGSDGLCAKGVLYTQLQLSLDPKDCLHVFTTHTQAGERALPTAVRWKQLQELVGFMQETISQTNDQSIPVLLTGDFNLDARNDISYPQQTYGEPRAMRCIESIAYKKLVQMISKVFDQKRHVIDLMKRLPTDPSSDRPDEIHPITNGDGHGRLVHRVYDEYTDMEYTVVERDGKCIDYMFFVPPMLEERTDEVHVQIDSEMNKNLLEINRLRPVLEETRVDHCDVASLFPIETQQILYPVTHLSDHYGLQAVFEHTPKVPIPSAELQAAFPTTNLRQHRNRLWQWKLTVALFGVASISVSTIVVITNTIQTYM